MQKNYPVTAVPNLQSFPENGFPVSAFYGIDSSLGDVTALSGSGGATGGGSALAQKIDPSSRVRSLIVVLVLVVAAYALFHWYMK